MVSKLRRGSKASSSAPENCACDMPMESSAGWGEEGLEGGEGMEDRAFMWRRWWWDADECSGCCCGQVHRGGWQVKAEAPPDASPPPYAKPEPYREDDEGWDSGTDKPRRNAGCELMVCGLDGRLRLVGAVGAGHRLLVGDALLLGLHLGFDGLDVGQLGGLLGGAETCGAAAVRAGRGGGGVLEGEGLHGGRGSGRRRERGRRRATAERNREGRVSSPLRAASLANIAAVALVGDVATLPPDELAAVVATDGDRKPRWEGEKEDMGEERGDSGCRLEAEEDDAPGSSSRTVLWRGGADAGQEVGAEGVGLMGVAWRGAVPSFDGLRARVVVGGLGGGVFVGAFVAVAGGGSFGAGGGGGGDNFEGGEVGGVARGTDAVGCVGGGGGGGAET